jgi:hypothetical protein
MHIPNWHSPKCIVSRWSVWYSNKKNLVYVLQGKLRLLFFKKNMMVSFASHREEKTTIVAVQAGMICRA